MNDLKEDSNKQINEVTKSIQDIGKRATEKINSARKLRFWKKNRNVRNEKLYKSIVQKSTEYDQ
jgi:hypothetical protein